MKLYTVLQITNEEANAFELGGIFSTEEKAIKACRDDNFCYIINELDYEYPLESVYGVTYFPTKNEIIYPNGEITKLL